MENIFLKRILIFWILILLGGASVITSVNSMDEDKMVSNILKIETWKVDDEGDGNFETIQEAVDAANSSDIIYVYSGNYSSFRIQKKDGLQIIGENFEYENGNDSGRPRVDGDGIGIVIEVEESNNVEITGFEIFNSGESAQNSGIYYYNSPYGTISNNIIRNNIYGAYARDSDHMKISDNIVIDNTKSGIFLESNHGTISHNECCNNTKDGILMSKARDNDIYNNNFTNNKHFGVFVVEEVFSISHQILDKNKIHNNNIVHNEKGFAVQINSLNTWEYNWWGAKLPYKFILINYKFEYWCLPIPIYERDPSPEENPV